MSELLSITEIELNIKYIYRVVENSIPKGHINPNRTGRHSDCFVLILNGSTLYTFDDKHFTVCQGDILYLSKGSIYSMDILTDSYKFIFVDFDFDIPGNTNLISDVFTVQSQYNTELSFRKLIKKWVSKQTAYKSECKSVLYDIYSKTIHSKTIPYVPQCKQKMLENAMQIILNNYTNDSLSITQLAKVSKMSEVHFRRLFKEIYSMSPIKYITMLRINQAKDLMQYKNLSITSIAETLGYANVYYFSKVFKNETGYPPTVYRNTLITDYYF